MNNEPRGALDGQSALDRLLEGNRRYVEGKPERPNQSPRYRSTLAHEQHPFALIFGCADSRVPPEIVLDQGLGDLFVVRVAGHTLDEDNVLASIEYAVGVLGVPLVMVLGHERCGAVKAALEAVEQGQEMPGHIGTLVEAIRPAVEETRGKPGDRLNNAVTANIRGVVRRLMEAGPVISAYCKEGKLRVVGARYDLDTGTVEVVSY